MAVLILLSALFFTPFLSSMLPSLLSSSSDRKKLLYKVRPENLYTKGQTLLITVSRVRKSWRVLLIVASVFEVSVNVYLTF